MVRRGKRREWEKKAAAATHSQAPAAHPAINCVRVLEVSQLTASPACLPACLSDLATRSHVSLTYSFLPSTLDVCDLDRGPLLLLLLLMMMMMMTIDDQST